MYFLIKMLNLSNGVAKVLRSDGGSGSAFLVSGNILVTAAHVVDQCDVINVKIEEEVCEATVLQSEPTLDLALLRVTDLPRTTHPLLIGTSSELTIGEDVLVAGFPLGSSVLTLHHGFLSAKGVASDFPAGTLTGLESNCPLLQIDATINEGFSGGPLLQASSNRVCGFITSKYGLLREFGDLRSELQGLIDHPITKQFASSGGGVIISGVDFGRFTAFIIQSLGVVSRTMQFLHVGIGYSVAIEVANSFIPQNRETTPH